MSVKVTHSSVKLTASPSSLSLFQSQGTLLAATLTTSAGEIDEIAVKAQSSAELLAALGQDDFTFEGGKPAKISLNFGNKSLLKAGKSYTLYLDVIPTHNAVNAKPAQVKLSVNETPPCPVSGRGRFFAQPGERIVVFNRFYWGLLCKMLHFNM